MSTVTPTGKPDGVVNSDKSVGILQNIILNAYDRVNKTLITGDYSTKARRNAIMRQLDKITEETDGLVKSWVNVTVPNFYEQGMFEATKNLSSRGDTVRIKTTFNSFHREAIEAISQDAYFHIAEAMKGLSTKGSQMVDMATRQALVEKIATGRIFGDTIKDIQKEIKTQLRSQGITALVDRGGREWDLDSYGAMLARTKLTQAQNTGVVNRMLESGYDLVQVSGHAGSCELCRPWEFQILSVSGRNSAFISLDEARNGGLFHPNCRHTITPYQNAYLEQSVIWDTEAQKYVPYSDFTAKRFNKPSYDYQTGIIKSDIPTGRVFTVYRAEDSANTGATLGQGKYFAFNKENVTRYGSDIKQYYLDPTAKMLELKTSKDLDLFEDEIREKYTGRFKELIDKYGAEEGLARAVTEYAKSLGFNGIVSDDQIFGSVVFDSKYLINPNSKQAEQVKKLIVSNDLRKYETAFNSSDLRVMEQLRDKYPTDSRFAFHVQFASGLKPTTQDFKNLLQRHKDSLDELGLTGIEEFNRLLEKGNKQELQNYVDKMGNTPLRKEIQNLINFI